MWKYVVVHFEETIEVEIGVIDIIVIYCFKITIEMQSEDFVSNRFIKIMKVDFPTHVDLKWKDETYVGRQ